MTNDIPQTASPSSDFSNLKFDLSAALVVALVALPLNLGIALASGAPVASGLISGIIGGIVVGIISGSHTSVTGPAAGMIAIVAAQIAVVGSFEAFLPAVVLSGLIQIGFGIARAGVLSAFFPSSVVKGLLAAIGAILILKQIPHLVGRDANPSGNLAFEQKNEHNTFSELLEVFQGNIHAGAITVGIVCILILVLWDRFGLHKRFVMPGALVATVIGVAISILFQTFGEGWLIGKTHLVQIPVPETNADWLTFFTFPDVSSFANPAVYLAAFVIAFVGSLETLLNLEAVDKLDTMKRRSPPSRELVAQGIGNTLAGLVGGIPMTSVVIRGSVNIAAGGKSKLSTIFHGLLILLSVVVLSRFLNQIPLAALAAILIVTGFKLASPALIRQMWKQGRYQFLPFIITLLAIVFTDILSGILLGLAAGLVFVLISNARMPVRIFSESHLEGEVTHLMLPNQVSFLKRAAIDKVLANAQPGTRLLIDASNSDYIDPDVLSLIREFRDDVASTRDVSVTLQGFRDKYQLKDEIEYVDYSSRELLDRMTPVQALQILRAGNERFRTGKRLTRDYQRQVAATAEGQHPFAAVLSCIDSRVPAEIVFDMGIGEMFSARVAGNVIGKNLLGSLEYAAVVSGVKVLVVLGHKHCGAVNASLKLLAEHADVVAATKCPNLPIIIDQIKPNATEQELDRFLQLSDEEKDAFADEVARRNVLRVVDRIKEMSQPIREAVASEKLLIIGAIYDVDDGQTQFLT